VKIAGVNEKTGALMRDGGEGRGVRGSGAGCDGESETGGFARNGKGAETARLVVEGFPTGIDEAIRIDGVELQAGKDEAMQHSFFHRSSEGGRDRDIGIAHTEARRRAVMTAASAVTPPVQAQPTVAACAEVRQTINENAKTNGRSGTVIGM